MTLTLPIGIAAFVWGVIARSRFDWTHAPGRIIHASVIGGALAAAVATHDTGGAHSPARFLLMLVLVFAGYCFPSREAWPYLGVAILVRVAYT